MKKFVIRLLNVTGEMLGWQEVEAVVPSDGTLRLGPCTVPVDLGGVVTQISAHWCDVNFEYRYSIEATKARRGTSMVIPEIRIEIGPPPVGLPGITTRQNVTISVPVGALSASGN